MKVTYFIRRDFGRSLPINYRDKLQTEGFFIEIQKNSNNNIYYNLDAVIMDLESKIKERVNYF